MRRPALGAVALVLMLPVPDALARAAAGPQEGRQVLRSTLDVVTVDVAVSTSRGEPITDLGVDDFEVTVDGQPRRVVVFRQAHAPAGTAPSSADAGPAPDADSLHPPERLFVLVVDRSSIRPRQGRSFLQAAAAFLDGLTPGDRAAVWTVPPDGGRLEPSRDRAGLKRQLLAATGLATPPVGLLGITPEEAWKIAGMNDRWTIDEVIARECDRRSNPGMDCEDEIQLEATRLVREMAAQAKTTIGSLQQLMKAIADFEGPKHIVLLTTGTYQTTDGVNDVMQVARAGASSRVRIHALQLALEDQVMTADRFARPAPQIEQRDSIAYTLAFMSGGMAITTTDAKLAFSRLSGLLTGSYELGFEALPGDRDGEPHRIAVRVPARRNVTVRARQEFRLFPVLAGDPAPPPAAAPAPAPPPAAPAPADAPITPVEAAADPPPPVSRPLPEDGGASLQTLVAKLGAYVDRFEREFSSAVAEERYVQLYRPWRGYPTFPSDEIALEWHDGGRDYPRSGPIMDRRQLLSDVLLVQTQRGWIGYRDVAVVDGRPVRDRAERVSKLFLSPSATRAGQLRRVAEESARFNLGRLRRTLNIPTLPLYFLHRRHHARYAFDHGGRDTIDGRRAAVVQFEERTRPTLVGTSAGEDVPLSGRVWIDQATGEVLQTETTYKPDGRRAGLLTRYRPEPAFGVLVPDLMWEWYDGGVMRFGSSAGVTLIECLARYTNYRRFTVATDEQPR